MRWYDMSALLLDWQTAIALLIVGGAVVALCRRAIGSIKPVGTFGCSACSHCAHSDASKIDKIELLQIEPKSPANR